MKNIRKSLWKGFCKGFSRRGSVKGIYGGGCEGAREGYHRALSMEIIIGKNLSGKRSRKLCGAAIEKKSKKFEFDLEFDLVFGGVKVEGKKDIPEKAQTTA